MKMTRRILSWVLAIAMVITCGITGLVLPASAETAENLFVNGDFEGGSTPEWGNSAYIVKGQGKDSDYGYYYKRTDEITDWYGAGDTSYKVALLGLLKENTTYIFSFDYKTSGDVQGQLYLNTCWGTLDSGKTFGQKKDSEGNVVAGTEQSYGLGTSVGKWTTKTWVFTTDENTIPSVPWELMFRTYRSTGEMWIDNFSLVEAPASVMLDKTEEYLTFGGTTTLTATGINCDLETIEWISSDETVATVKDGVVTANSKEGKTIITAKSGETTATCVVSVFQYKNLMPNWDFSAETSGYVFTNAYKTEDGTSYASGNSVPVVEEQDGNRYIVLPEHLSNGVVKNETSGKYSYTTVMSPKLTSLQFNEQIVQGDYYVVRVRVKNPSGKKAQVQFEGGIVSYKNYSVSATQTDWVELHWLVKADRSGKSFYMYYDTSIDKSGESYSERTQTGAYLYIDDVQVYHLPSQVDNTFNLMPAGDCEEAIPSSLMGLGANLKRDVEENGNHYLANKSTSKITTWVKFGGTMTAVPVATTTVGEKTKDVYYKISYRFKGGKAYFGSATSGYYDTVLTVGNTVASSEWQEVTVYLIYGKGRTANITQSPDATYFSYFNMEKGACVDDLEMYAVTNAEEIRMLDAVVTAGGGTTTLEEAVTVPENAYPGNITYTADIPQHTVVDSYTTDSLYTFKFDSSTRKVTGGQGFKGGDTMTVTATSDLGITDEATVSLVYPKELITNGDLEDTTKASWGAEATYETVKGIDGEDTRAWKNTGTLLYYKHALYFKPGAIYRVRVDAKGSAKVNFRMQTVNDLQDPGTEFVIGGSTEWKTYEYFLSSVGDEPYTHDTNKKNRPNQGWSLHIRAVTGNAPTEANPLYLDNFRIEEVAVAEYTESTELVDGVETDVVTATLTPGEGYTMVPGTVKYTDRRTDTNTWNGSVNMLNKDLTGTQGFGAGSGNVFQAKKPTDPTIVSYKVTGVTAQFTEGDYAMDTIGASVHQVTDENGDVVEGEYDGIRFLTRLNLADGFNADAEGAMTVKVGDATYKIVEIGSLLKRKSNDAVLDLTNAEANVETAGANRMWISRAYTEEKGVYTLVDYTKSYIDFTVVMKTTDPTREYTARGYMVLENVANAEDTIEVYSETSFSDSINSVASRL